jgi:hypothetical protein
MSKHRVPRTGQAMLTFFGDLIARQEIRFDQDGQEHEYGLRLFRTEAPGYVLAIRYGSGGATLHWAAHTPSRLKVADLFERYSRENTPPGPALDLFARAMQAIMLQAPELDEMVQWSSVVASD